MSEYECVRLERLILSKLPNDTVVLSSFKTIFKSLLVVYNLIQAPIWVKKVHLKMNESELRCEGREGCSSPVAIACNCGVPVVYLCVGCISHHVFRPGEHRLIRLSHAQQFLTSSISPLQFEESNIKHLKFKSDILKYIQSLKDFKSKVSAFKLEILDHIEKTIDSKFEELDSIIDRTCVQLYELNQKPDMQKLQSYEENGLESVIHNYVYNMALNVYDVKEAINAMITIDTRDSSQVEDSNLANIPVQVQELKDLLQAQAQRFEELENRLNQIQEGSIRQLQDKAQEFIESIGDLQDKTDELEGSVRYQEGKVERLEDNIQQQDYKSRELEEFVRDLGDKGSEFDRFIRYQEAKTQEIEESLRRQEDKSQELEESMRGQMNKTHELEESMRHQEGKAQEFEGSINDLEERVGILEESMAEQVDKSQTLEESMTNLQENVQGLGESMRYQQYISQELEESIRKQDDKYVVFEKNMRDQEDKSLQLERSIKSLEDSVRKQLENFGVSISSHASCIAHLQANIKSLLDSIENLRNYPKTIANQTKAAIEQYEEKYKQRYDEINSDIRKVKDTIAQMEKIQAENRSKELSKSQPGAYVNSGREADELTPNINSAALRLNPQPQSALMYPINQSGAKQEVRLQTSPAQEVKLQTSSNKTAGIPVPVVEKVTLKAPTNQYKNNPYSSVPEARPQHNTLSSLFKYPESNPVPNPQGLFSQPIFSNVATLVEEVKQPQTIETPRNREQLYSRTAGFSLKNNTRQLIKYDGDSDFTTTYSLNNLPHPVKWAATCTMPDGSVIIAGGK